MISCYDIHLIYVVSCYSICYALCNVMFSSDDSFFPGRPPSRSLPPPIDTGHESMYIGTM